MFTLEATNRSHTTNTPRVNFNSIPDQQLSKLSFKDTIKLFNDSETQPLLLIKDILRNEKSNKVKYQKIKSLVLMPQLNYFQRMKIFKILKTSPEFKPHILLINSIAEDLYKAGVMPRIDTDKNQDDPKKIVSFSFNDNNTDEQNTFRLPDRAITSGSGSSLYLSKASRPYYEDINKPPIFESNLIVNKFAPLSTYQHTFIGLRYTEYDKKNKRYTRKFFRVGFAGMDYDHLMLTLFNKKSPAEIRCQTDDRTSVSTQTPISVSQVKRLVDNIYVYFRKYKYYQFYSRNCNTFVKEIASSIGANNISSFHDSVAPSSVANKASKLISEPDDNSVDCFVNYNYEYKYLEVSERKNELVEFCTSHKLDNFLEDYKEEIEAYDNLEAFTNNFSDQNFSALTGFQYNDSKHKDFKSFYSHNTWNKTNFINNAISESRKDLNLIDKLMGRTFKNERVQTNINNIADNIDDIINENILQVNQDIYVKNELLKAQDTILYLTHINLLNNHIKELKEQFNSIQSSIKETIKLSGKSQINLNVYLMKVLNLLQKLISHSTESFERDERLETQDLQLKHKILMLELKHTMLMRELKHTMLMPKLNHITLMSELKHLVLMRELKEKFNTPSNSENQR